MPNLNLLGAGVRYTVRGDGPRCIFSHCALAHSGVWFPLLKSLSCEAVLWDLPDHGRSDPCPDGIDVQRFSADVIKSLANQPVHLVGHSFGGTATLLAALELGERVQSITLIEPVQFCAAQGSSEYQEYSTDFEPFVRAWQQGDLENAAKCFVNTWGGPGGWAVLSAEQQTAMSQQIHVIPAQSAALNEDINGILASGRLEALSPPVTLIEGSESAPIIGAIHDVLERRLPNVKRRVIEGAGHMSPFTHMSAVAAAMPGEFKG